MESSSKSVNASPLQTGKDAEKSSSQNYIDECFIGIAEEKLLRVYQSIFNSVKDISSHLRYSTSKLK